MLQALSGMSENDAWNIAAIAGQTYFGAEIFGGLALLFSFISVIFLTQWLLTSRFFGEIKQPMPERIVNKKKLNWWIFATVNTAIAAVFFGLFTHADIQWNFAKFAEPLQMGMINNWLGFFLTTAAAAAFLVGLWYLITHLKNRGSISPYDMGITYSEKSGQNAKAGLRMFGKTALLAIILFTWMYLLVSIFQIFFLTEFRIFWVFAKMFTPQRFIQFLLYLPIFLPFFFVNGGVFLFGQIRQEEARSSSRTYAIWWVKIIFATLFGLIIFVLIQYIGVMINNYPMEGWWIAPIMPLQLFAAIPFYALLYFMMIFFYRKTGKIYLGSLFGAIITVWFLSVGSVLGPAL
jgi:hypothetical protein